MHLVLLLLLFPTISVSKQSLHFPLLSLSCIPSLSPQTRPKPILDNLTSLAPNSLFVTATSPPYSALLQCRPSLTPTHCALCTNTARNTILTLCRHAAAVSAWFDGCYAQIQPGIQQHSTHSCSPQITNQDPARFNPALETLLLQLRADISIPTRHRFASGHISYDDSGEIEGLVECVMSLSTQECDACVAKAMEMVQVDCGGKDGGFAVAGPCLVRFHYQGRTAAGMTMGVSARRGVSSSGASNVSGGWGDGDLGKGKAAMAYWGGGFGCLLVVVFLVCLLKNAVLNRTRVGALEFTKHDAVGKTTTQG